MSFAAVIFDFFATLTPGTPEHVWQEHTARSAAPLGLDVATWRRALDESWAERATGALGDLPATFRELARRNGVVPDDQALAAACAARRTAQDELFVFRPDALAVLAKIRARGLKVGVLSDCTVELAEAWSLLPVARLVDVRVLSCEAGRRKPDPVLFATVAGQLGVAPQHCLYLGDGGGRELSGASAAGMHAVMLRAADWYTNSAHAREDDWAGPWVPTLSAVLPLLAEGRRRAGGAPAGDAGVGSVRSCPPILRLVPTMPAVPRRGRPPRHNRSEILDAASEVMIFRGYGATRYSDVAEASGVPVASLQHHFPTLAVLRREALRNKVRAELTSLAEQVSVIADPWERVSHIIVRSVSLDPARRRGGWVLWLEYYRAAAHDQALAEDSREVSAQWLSLIADSIADGVQTGQFHPDGTVAEAAQELHGLLDGLGIRLAIEHDDADAADAITLLERSARRMLRLA